MMLVNFPIYTVDNQPLVPEGSVLSRVMLQGLVSSNSAKYQRRSLLEHGTVKNDLLRQVKRPPYDVIFSQEKIKEVMAVMKQVHFAMPILQTLDYFRKDDYRTYCHLIMVFAISVLLVRDLLPGLKRKRSIPCDPTHDIGKACIPLHILKKQTPLNMREKSIIDNHTIAGYVLLSYYQKDPQIPSAVVSRDHHERKDGSGSPRGIKLRNRIVEIIVACDVYDALISPRPYRSDLYDNRAALEEITKMAEMNKIGWEVVKCLLAHNRKSQPKFSDVIVSKEKRGIPPADNWYGVIRD